MSGWTVRYYPLSCSGNRSWHRAMSLYPTGLSHEIEVSFIRFWLVELPDEYRVLLTLGMSDVGVVDVGNGWMQVPRLARPAVWAAISGYPGTWMIGRAARFRTTRAKNAWDALIDFS